jgi:stage II sporulation protein R
VSRKLTLGLLLLWTGVVMIAAGLMNIDGRPAAAAASAADTDSLIRLHVVANSDSDADQALKRAVRDAILEQVTPMFASLTTRAEAEAAIRTAIPEIEATAARVIAANGQRYTVTAEVGQFDFPARSYGDYFVPAGKYTALKVLIGEAKGANWWCVLFPPMCFLDWSTGVVLEPKPGSNGTQTVTVPRKAAPVLVDDEGGKPLPVKARFAVWEWAKARMHR